MRNFAWTLIALLGLVLASCSQQEVKRSAKAKHVIMIGIDGWASKSMAQADMPTVKGKLMAEGSYTLEKRSVLQGA